MSSQPSASLTSVTSGEANSGSVGSSPLIRAIENREPGRCCVCSAIVDGTRIRCHACHAAYLATVTDLRKKAPYPFCSTPEKCIASGRCKRDPCCNN